MAWIGNFVFQRCSNTIYKDRYKVVGVFFTLTCANDYFRSSQSVALNFTFSIKISRFLLSITSLNIMA